MFAVLSVALVLALAFAAGRSHFTEWRRVEDRYNQLAQQKGLPTIERKVRQVWRPELGVVDRCGTCHLGAAGETPLPSEKGGERTFDKHPDIPHDAREFGCTVCHGGDGRATTSLAAHEGMLERPQIEAGCATCHSGLIATPGKAAAHGRKVVDEAKCDACHGAKKDLATIGLHGFRNDWHARHAEKAGAATEGEWTKFQPLAEDEQTDVSAFLHTQVGAPRLMQAKALVAELGCRGCHRIGGVGGDDGPDLSGEGDRRVADLDFRAVTMTGPYTLAAWERAHLLAPARVVPGSKMLDLHLDGERADQLTLFAMSQRERAIPETFAPRDRYRVRKLGERDFATEPTTAGATLYGVFCVACHGADGAGGRFEEHALIPAIGDPDFLALVDDGYLRRAINEGRPGRRMPSWGARETGLHSEEVDALVAWLRAREPTAPTMAEVMAAPVDLANGKQLFAAQCAPCHGTGGEGSQVAPPLAAKDNPVLADDSRIYGTVTVGVAGTAMGSFRRFDAHALRGLLAAVRALPPTTKLRTGWAPQKGDASRGAPLFKANCARCHGERAEGKDGPALANPAFRAIATEGFLTATILRGRGQMPKFGEQAKDHEKLSPAQVADIVAFLKK